MSLSSLIVQREIATIRQVEEALARQVLYGGDIVTNLLEVAEVDEARLNDVAAEAAGLLPAPSGMLADPDARARALIPGDLAVRRALYPLRMNDEAEQLLVAVAEPLSSGEEEELMFALGVPIEQRLAPLVRVRQALSRVYGAPLERRFERLALRLSGEAVSLSESRPPLHGAPLQPGSLPQAAPVPDVEQPGRFLRMPSQRPTNLGFAVNEGPTEKTALVLEGISPEAEPEPVTAPDLEPKTEVTPTDPMALPPVTTDPSGAPRDPRREALLKELSLPVRRVRRRRGPMTLDVARAELDEVETRDSILDLFFDFARQYFEYSAIFVVHGDIAEGRDAYGPGASRDKIAGVGVPLDLPSLFAGARATSGAILREPERDGLDPVLMRDLERQVETPVLALPLIVRGRCVAIFYGDAADAGVDTTLAGDVVAFSGLLSQAFERLIVRKKLGGFSGGAPSTSPSSAAGRVMLTEEVTSQLAAVGAASSSKRLPHAPVDAARGAEALGRAMSGPPISPRAEKAEKVEKAESTGEDDATFSIPRRHTEPQPTPATLVVRRASGPPIPRGEPDDADPPPTEQVAPPRHIAPGSIPPLPLDSNPSLQASPAIAPAPIEASPPGPEVSSHELDDEAARSLLSEIATVQDGSPDLPPPSQSIAVPPHHPPSSRTDGEALPSVIVDVGGELDDLVERFVKNVDDEQAEAELLRQGQHAMGAIVARFPGPVVLEPRLHDEDPPLASASGPLLRLVAMQRRVAVPSVLPFLEDGDEARRFWATYLLAELAYPEVIEALIPRFSDVSERVRRAALLSAASIAKTYGDELAREVGRVVRDAAAPRERRLEMLTVLEDIRCAFAVPTFIAVLGDADEEVANASRRALLVITRQDFSSDARRWTTWWNQNSSRHRVEWLIDALAHDAQTLRRAAGEELKAITKEYFGYYDDLPKRERERAQARYRDWWRTEGHLRFVR